MILHNWGEIDYITAREQMQKVHEKAKKDGKNHLILCSHPNVFTVGKDETKKFNIDVLQSDRGGSITCHSVGQNIYYFCFQVSNPAQFYKKVLQAFEMFFQEVLPEVTYDKKSAGFYIQNRKIASLGFRYSQGVSLHGVALNVNVDLDFHSQVPPCDLEGIVATSLQNEGITLTLKHVNKIMLQEIQEVFNDTI
ncbi:lipoyl protein ligase domain-containing protein [Sulfurimonas sp.]